jgi:uncharacterized DUF497 family protein
MDFDWTNPPFTLASDLPLEEIESSFDDPFALKLMPDSPRFSVQARFFNLGLGSTGTGVFTVYRTNGKSIRVVHARRFEAEERFLHQRNMNQQLEAAT